MRRISIIFAFAVAVIVPSTFAATTGHAAPPASATLTWTSRIADLFGPGDGKTRTYTASNYDFNISATSVSTEDLAIPIGPGNIGFIVSSKDLTKFTNPAILMGFTTPSGRPFTPGTFKVTSSVGTHKKDSPDGSASVHFSTPTPLGPCNSEDTAGTFTVLRAEYEVVPIDGTKLTAYHPLALQIHFELRCTVTAGVFAGDFVMKDNPFPDGTPWSPTSTGGTGTGGTPQPTSGGPTVILPDSVIAGPLVLANSTTAIVPFSTFIPATVTGDVALTATTDTDSVLASISPAVIPLGASGDAILTIRTTANTTAGDHSVTITASDGVTTPGSATVFFTIICDPPFILGIDQPKSSTVSPGRPALLSVKASGSGPFSYQWFTGSSGLVNFPLAGGTTANFTTSAINDTASYWVRITNACGSADSQTATINVSAGAKPARR